jgi:hypothetical protein
MCHKGHELVSNIRATVKEDSVIQVVHPFGLAASGEEDLNLQRSVYITNAQPIELSLLVRISGRITENFETQSKFHMRLQSIQNSVWTFCVKHQKLVCISMRIESLLVGRVGFEPTTLLFQE